MRNCIIQDCKKVSESKIGACNMHYKRFKRNGNFERKNKLPSNSRFYTIWRKMKQRCFDVKENNYQRYGGRGIMVCERWLNFNNFFDDMYQRYILFGGDLAKISIDRINNDLGYQLENCRWATVKQQRHNRREK